MREVSLREVPEKPEARPRPSARPEAETTTSEDVPGRLVCDRCGALITFGSERCEKNGSHEHSFMNPEGIRFKVGCFRSAPGASGVGESSSVWTWFPGHAWQAVVCRACFGHVGWAFTNGASGFFALILDRLREELPPRRPH